VHIDPPLREARRFPVTLLVAVSSIVLSLLFWSTRDVDALVATRANAAREPWALLSSTLLHLDAIHLLFNLSWWWPFAARLEYAWGKWRLIGVTVLLAAVSGAAQVALSRPGVGLSGVIYGLFAMLAVAQRTHPALNGLVTRRTVQLMGGWFVVCVVLSIAGVWRVGNVAHGAGAVIGWLLGKCIVTEPRARKAWIGAIAGVCVLCGAALAAGVPWVKPVGVTSRNAHLGMAAMDSKDWAEAARLLELAHKESPADTVVMINLGIAYQELHRDDEAVALYREAVRLDPSLRANVAPSIAAQIARNAEAAAEDGDLVAAHELITEALEWAPDDPRSRATLAAVRKALSVEAPHDGR
jgi:GlpG protein